MISEIEKLLKKRFSLVLIVVGLIFLVGCGSPNPPVSWSFSGLTMGTTWHVKVVGIPPTQDGKKALDRKGLRTEIQQELVEVNRLMSIFQADSEISRFNQYTGKDWFPVSPELADLIRVSLEVNRMSAGMFDVTAGPLIDLWGFGVVRDRGIPGKEEIQAALSRTGSRYLKVRMEPPALRKEIPTLYCNLSAVAKGYGVDLVAGVLEKRGFGNFMVEIGGEVSTLGFRSGGGRWRIGIAAPTASEGLQRVVPLSGRSMATSGDYQNYFEVDGVRYSHTINPGTGRPVIHDLASVTVIADTCMRADALATALLVLGPESGMRLAESMNLPVLLIRRTPEGAREMMSEDFRSQIEVADPNEAGNE